VAATVLGGVHAGITAQLDPGPPVTGNGYASDITATLPRDWLGAIDAAAGSNFLRETLGESFLSAFIAIKTQEWDKFNALVPATDHDWYLDSV
jgi:glutamine synthetase